MKVAICMPCYGYPKAGFTLSLAQMIYFSARKMPETELVPLMVLNSTITAARHDLVEQAKRHGASHILWLDTDHTFPPHTLQRLLSFGVEAIGCNYARRSNPTGPTAARRWGEDNRKINVWTTDDLARRQVIEPVAHLGLGVCLVAMAAIDKIDPPYFRDPGEDIYFFDKLAAVGVQAFVDHGLSSKVGHVAEQVLFNSDAVEQKQEWLERQAQSGTSVT